MVDISTYKVIYMIDFREADLGIIDDLMFMATNQKDLYDKAFIILTSNKTPKE